MLIRSSLPGMTSSTDAALTTPAHFSAPPFITLPSKPSPLTTAPWAPRDLEWGLHGHLALLVEKRDSQVRGEDVDLAELQAKE